MDHDGIISPAFAGSIKGHGGPAGRNTAKAKAPPTRKTPSPHVSSSEDEGHLPTDQVEISPQQDMPPLKRKKAPPLNLTREQEVPAGFHPQYIPIAPLNSYQF